MNKLTAEKCREDFESWYSAMMGTPLSVLKNLRDGGRYRDTEGARLDIAWEAWTDSREALEIALPVLERQSGWVSCGDRMPEREGHYLVFAEASNLEGYCDHNDIAAYQGGEWSNEFGWLVTHWQPLPEFPQKESTTDTYRQIENDGRKG